MLGVFKISLVALRDHACWAPRRHGTNYMRMCSRNRQRLDSRAAGGAEFKGFAYICPSEFNHARFDDSASTEDGDWQMWAGEVA